jgi:transcription elongation factor GreA
MQRDVLLTPEGLDKLKDEIELVSNVVRVGSLVSVKDEGSGKALKYTIVGSTEANPSENRLSNESPVGKGLLGRKKGDTVKVTLPNGKTRELKITKIDVA